MRLAFLKTMKERGITMKKVFSLILALVMCLSLCACGIGKDKKEKSMSERAADAVRAQINVYITLHYDTNGVPQVTTYVNETSMYQFEVSGKVTIRDKYGDTFTGKYDATAIYNPLTDEFDVDYEVGKLYKD